MLFSLIPADALFILRPLATIIISIFFLIFFKIIQRDYKREKKIISNLILFLLTILLFILISKFAKISLLSSIIIGFFVYSVIYFVIYKIPSIYRVVLLLLLLILNKEYISLDRRPDSPNYNNIDFFTFGFNNKTTYYNSQNEYSGKIGLSKIYDDIYWGFNKVFPIRGRVYFPVKKGKYPLVFVLHGNHLAENDSHKGYDYLLKHLALNNYIGIAIDQNFLNGDWTNLGVGQPYENDVRAYHLLESIKYFQLLDNNIDSQLYNKIKDEVFLIGHSRGGEAVSIAASLTDKIKAVVALAPTDRQYKRRIELHDSSYLLIQGANDGDLRRNRGISQFNRVIIDKNSKNKKASLFINGFNHSQFNSDWGKYDGTGIGNVFYSNKDLVNSKIQKKITNDLIISFFKSEEVFDINIPNNSLLNSLDYFYNYFDKSHELLCNFNTIDSINMIKRDNVDITLEFRNDNYFIKTNWRNNGKVTINTRHSEYIENLYIPISNPDNYSKQIKVILLPSEEEVIITVKKDIQWKYLRFNILQKNKKQEIAFNQYKIPVNNIINGIKIVSLDNLNTLYIDDLQFTSHQKIE